jgi:hypothetical protein
MDIQKINRRNSLNESLNRLHGELGTLFKLFGKDVDVIMERYEEVKTDIKECLKILNDIYIVWKPFKYHKVERIDRMLYNEKEFNNVVADIERIEKKAKAREKDNEEFLDRIYAHTELNKLKGGD